jgi:hypothetical protein
MITLELTPEEALALRNLLDAAVRAGGMRAAEVAILLDAKILAAAAKWQSEQQAARPAGNGGAAVQS